MIIQCEKCATRFKVADDKVTDKGIRVRCSKCQHVFTAHANGAPSSTAAPPTTPPTPVDAARLPPRPTGIFASPGAPDATGEAGSASFGVPQASLANQAPAFNPFEPPSGASKAPAPSAGAPSFEFEDAPAGAAGSPFGAPNLTIGAYDDDVPVPPPPELEDEPPAPPPAPAEEAMPAVSSSDPFAHGVHAAQSSDPFASQPPAPAAAAADPFGYSSGPSSAAALPAAGDPFSAPATADPFGVSADPFGGAADPFANAAPAAATVAAGADPFGAAPGQDPFAGGGAVAPPAPGGEDPFSGLGVEVDDPYAPAPEEPAAPPPPPPSQVTTSQPAPVAAKAPKAEAAAPKKPRRRITLRIPPAVPRAAWAVAQACILVGFLSASIVWVRGGTLDDVRQGRGLSVVLGTAASTTADAAPVRAEEVVVARRPVGAAKDLVVVSGFVVNAGDVDAPAARVTVRFGEGAPTGSWANAGIDGVDLAAASDERALLALNDKVPETALLKSGDRVPFVVLARGVPDGAKATVVVEVSEPPKAKVEARPPPGPEEPGATSGKKLRRRAPKPTGQGAAARPAERRAGAEG